MIIEKSIDSFESGVKTLLERNHFPPLTHVDALSLRCFAFARDGTVEDWFRPVISCEAAIQRLGQLMGTEGCWTIRRYQSGQDLPEGLCMAGPVKEAVLLPDLRHHYYHGAASYFCYDKQPHQTIFICDFNGMPMMPLDEHHLRDILERNNPFLICLNSLKKPGNFTLLWDNRRLLADGLQFHKAFRHQETAKMRTCSKSGRQYVSLQYALMNYGIQLRKMVDFVETVIGLDAHIEAKIHSLWMQLQQIRMDAAVEAIEEWENNLWKEIFTHAENNGIIL